MRHSYRVRYYPEKSLFLLNLIYRIIRVLRIL